MFSTEFDIIIEPKVTGMPRRIKNYGPIDPIKRCPDCGRSAGEPDPRDKTGKTRFYRGAYYCVVDQRLRQKESLAKDSVRLKINEANLRWLRNHPEAAKRARAATREKAELKKLEPKPRPPGSEDMMTQIEAAAYLGITRQRVNQYHQDKRLVGVRLPKMGRGGGLGKTLWFKVADVERFKRDREEERQEQGEGSGEN
jgi:hypothetical protein